MLRRLRALLGGALDGTLDMGGFGDASRAVPAFVKVLNGEVTDRFVSKTMNCLDKTGLVLGRSPVLAFEIRKGFVLLVAHWALAIAVLALLIPTFLLGKWVYST